MNGSNQQTRFDQTPHKDLITCLWMEAGVVDYKLCDRAFDCEHCPFDEAVQSRSAKMILAAELFGDHVDAANVSGCEVAPDLFYDPTHVWARVEECGVVRMGIDDFGQRMLGRTYSLIPSPANAVVRSGDECCRVTHQSGTVRLSAPVSGQIRQTNPILAQRPEVMNHEPYGEGWILLIEPSNLKGDLKRLMYGERARDWLKREIEKLRTLINRVSHCEAPTMTDGGFLTQDFMSELNVAQRRQVIDSFFPPAVEEKADRNHAIKFSKRR